MQDTRGATTAGVTVGKSPTTADPTPATEASAISNDAWKISCDEASGADRERVGTGMGNQGSGEHGGHGAAAAAAAPKWGPCSCFVDVENCDLLWGNGARRARDEG